MRVMSRQICGFAAAVVIAAVAGSAIALRDLNAVALAPFALLLVLPIAVIFGIPAIWWLHSRKKTSPVSFVMAGVFTGIVFAVCDALRAFLFANGLSTSQLFEVLLRSLIVGVSASVLGALVYWAVVVPRGPRSQG
jgi:hypothetical protein